MNTQLQEINNDIQLNLKKLQEEYQFSIKYGYNDSAQIEARFIEVFLTLQKLTKILNEVSVAAPNDEQSKDTGYDYTQMSGC